MEALSDSAGARWIATAGINKLGSGEGKKGTRRRRTGNKKIRIAKYLWNTPATSRQARFRIDGAAHDGAPAKSWMHK
jgi:hypothetical protein